MKRDLCETFALFVLYASILGLCIVMMSLLSGCEDEGPRYPREIAAMCEQALADARACIKGVNGKAQAPGWPEVVLVRGEKKISGFWCWRSPEWKGAWVGGLFDRHNGRYRVRVGHNPANRADVNPDVIKHEMGHFVLVSSFSDWSHSAAYRNCFLYWSGPVAPSSTRSRKPRPVEITSGEQIVTLFYEDEITRLESMGVDVAD